MKILFLTNIPSPYRVDFFNTLGKLCDLTVAFEGKSATDRNKSWQTNSFSNFRAVFLSGIRTNHEQFFCPKVLKIIKIGFDKIIVGGYSSPTNMLAIEYMRSHHIPFIIEVDGGIISNDSFLKYHIKKHFISSASGWLSTGNVTSNYLVHYGAVKERVYRYSFSSQLKSDILETVPSSQAKKKIQDKLGMREEGIVISVGQFIHRKGFDILLKAWKKIPVKYGLYIIGAEPTAEYLELQQNLALENVHFVGFKSKQELKEYYIAADLFAFPTREDIWGLVINEAMSNALPVITTDRCVAGLELLKDGENGYIVPVNDCEALSEKIIAVMKNPVLRGRMAQANLDKIRSYSIEHMAEEHMAILGNI